MTARAELEARLQALCREAEANAEAEPAQRAFAACRRAGRDAFQRTGLPGRRQEEWRYTKLTPLEGPAWYLPQDDAEVDRARMEALAAPIFTCGLAVFVNGYRRQALSGLPAGDVEVSPLEAAGGSLPGGLVDMKQHPFAALNAALAQQGVLVRVPEGAALDHPVHLLFVCAARRDASLSSPRILVEACPGSRAVVVQDHVAVDGGRTHFTNAVTEVHVREGASLDLVLLQREGENDMHISNTAVRMERGARFAAHTITLGGRLVRNDLGVTLEAPGADCTLNGLFLGAGRRVIDNHTLVDHAAPHATSRELYKGVLADDARGVFRGRVIVRPGAQGSDASQHNPNLLLGDGAEVDTKPQLEIHADDVKCSHGCAIGRSDEDALFYLRSRGIDKEQAQLLLTQGFASDVLQMLPERALVEAMDQEFIRRLGECTWC